MIFLPMEQAQKEIDDLNLELRYEEIDLMRDYHEGLLSLHRKHYKRLDEKGLLKILEETQCQ